MTEKLFPNGVLVCPDCNTTMILEAKNYDSPETMAADVETQLGHHNDNRCHPKNEARHKEFGAAAEANRKLQAQLRKDAQERMRARAPGQTHTQDQVNAMLAQALAELKSAKENSAPAHE
jgi:hypothetical protein